MYLAFQLAVVCVRVLACMCVHRLLGTYVRTYVCSKYEHVYLFGVIVTAALFELLMKMVVEPIPPDDQLASGRTLFQFYF